MDFDELQVIWNKQNNEKMYAINENVLYNHIKHKGQSVSLKLNIQEFVLMGCNLFAGIQLTVSALKSGSTSLKLFLSAFYLAFAIYGVIRHFTRRKDERPFDHTLLGELDKAIWQIDYLMQQNRNLIRWYILPLTLLFGVTSFFSPKYFMAFVVCLGATLFAYFTSRWENNKFHIPNKQSLETLRNKLTTQENH